MNWTLPEIDPSFAFRPVVVRNPLLEVRWLAFLRGDAYVNPLHDLLHALSRSPAATVDAGADHLRQVRFLPERLEIIGPDGKTVALTYQKLLDLRLNYNGFFSNQGAGAGSYASFLEFTAETEEKVYSFNLKISGTDFRRMLAQLYDRRIPFRECHNGLRTFKLRHLSYAQIQQVKKEYGIRW